MYPVASLNVTIPVPLSCILLTFIWMLCPATAWHAISCWNICLKLFLLSLCFKLSLCLQYRSPSAFNSSLRSIALSNFHFPVIQLLKPLGFSHSSRNISSCFVFGGRSCGCSSPSVIASCTAARSATRALSSMLGFIQLWYVDGQTIS